MTKRSGTSLSSAWVLGSTSTVATAICRALAERGCLAPLLARNLERNHVLADELRERFGAEVSCEAVDLLAPDPFCLN